LVWSAVGLLWDIPAVSGAGITAVVVETFIDDGPPPGFGDHRQLAFRGSSRVGVVCFE
jgi:hypothetical protein